MGQGPDELFGGYRRHLGLRYAGLWTTMPAWVRGPWARAITALPRNETLKSGAYPLDIPERMRRYQHVLSLLPENDINGCFETAVRLIRQTRSFPAGRISRRLVTDTDEFGRLSVSGAPVHSSR